MDLFVDVTEQEVMDNEETLYAYIKEQVDAIRPIVEAIVRKDSDDSVDLANISQEIGMLLESQEFEIVMIPAKEKDLTVLSNKMFLILVRATMGLGSGNTKQALLTSKVQDLMTGPKPGLFFAWESEILSVKQLFLTQLRLSVAQGSTSASRGFWEEFVDREEPTDQVDRLTYLRGRAAAQSLLQEDFDELRDILRMDQEDSAEFFSKFIEVFVAYETFISARRILDGTQ